ncbi:Panacea domain-containing protein [Ciceribacter sp. T2.26MG-112.2]|uniref:Panacea domain-containing protein n=1 Tax=Ciceribacter sp. T2.26MG-112.2 TaxID=3137154 RepID=UPI0012B69B4A|nr:Panacea domain-containing protein [Ciceribacter naphthalenivorans]
MADWYNSKKAAQIAAYYAIREGGAINVLKLVKLIYLSERAFLAKFDSSMLNDKLVSMDNGPVNSITLNKINGFVEDNGWSEFISDRENHLVSIANKSIKIDVLDELSRAELKVLDTTWNEFGHMDQWQLVDFTHKNCPEWEDPHGSSSPIPYERLLKAIGKQNVNELQDRIMTDRRLVSALRD